MKKAIYISALMLLFSHQANADETKVITLATGEFPPHISEKLPEKGTFSEIVTRSFKNAGYKVELKFLPWKRAYNEAKMVKVDGTYSWTPKPKREKDFEFSDPIFVLERRIFVMKESSIHADEIEELTGLRLCRPLAYTLHGKFEQMVANHEINLVRPPDMVTCFKFLKEGRVDFIELAYEEGITSARKAMGTLDLVRTLNFLPGQNPNSLGISHSHPQKDELMAAFNTGLQQLRDSGDYDEIVRRHHLIFLDTLTN
ncbi:ABC transporter substrate-binding protein [Terasakiella sp. A23]|uniref:substrate-binding periplasmic protein n=1 Tax=Terasakiella sp. FCG-A23 TaxID=3080561 RepID=UPI002955C20C|nr:ABC transporter substrate-binding protein [Terasakiella sp. A23]MDV7338641.1 ABC transporter substrate-binding protein [Terasakiella sp. A23]